LTVASREFRITATVILFQKYLIKRSLQVKKVIQVCTVLLLILSLVSCAQNSLSTFNKRFDEAEKDGYGSSLAAIYASSKNPLDKFNTRFYEARDEGYGNVLACNYAASTVSLQTFNKRFDEAESAGYGSALAALFAGSM